MVGVEPHTISKFDTSSPEKEQLCNLIFETCELRDSCLKLQKRPVYREYPLFWVLHELPKAGYIVEDSKIFPSYTGKHFIKTQIGVASKHMFLIESPSLRLELETEIKRIQDKMNKLPVSDARFMDYYVIIARKNLNSSHNCRDPFKLLCPTSLLSAINSPNFIPHNFYQTEL